MGVVAAQLPIIHSYDDDFMVTSRWVTESLSWAMDQKTNHLCYVSHLLPLLHVIYLRPFFRVFFLHVIKARQWRLSSLWMRWWRGVRSCCRVMTDWRIRWCNGLFLEHTIPTSQFFATWYVTTVFKVSEPFEQLWIDLYWSCKLSTRCHRFTMHHVSDVT